MVKRDLDCYKYGMVEQCRDVLQQLSDLMPATVRQFSQGRPSTYIPPRMRLHWIRRIHNDVLVGFSYVKSSWLSIVPLTCDRQALWVDSCNIPRTY
jgi:hypothetical protein